MTPVPTAVRRPWWETRWCIAFALLLAAVPLLWPAIPPLTDVPAALAHYRGMLNAGAGPGAWCLAHGRPCEVDLIVASLAPLIGLVPAVKAIIVTVPVIAAAGMLWLSREAHGRVQPVAYLALPFAYHPAFLHGLVGIALAMALALNAVALWMRLARWRRLRAGVFVVLSALVWAVHPLGWASLGVMIFAAELVRARAVECDTVRRGWAESGWRAAVNCLPIAPPALMLLAWRPDAGDVGGAWVAALALKPGWVLGALRDRWRLLDWGSIVLVALMIHRSYQDRRFVHAPMLVAAALGLLALLVAVPSGPAGAAMAVAPCVIVLALLSIRFNARVTQRRRAELAWAALAFLVVRTAAGTASFAAENRDWTRHLAARDHIPRGARVAAFVSQTCVQPWRIARTDFLPDMAAVWGAAPAHDRSGRIQHAEIVMDAPCPSRPESRTLDQALADLPRARYDLIWLITPGRIDPARLGDVRLVWSDGRDVLFALPHARAPR
jgi:hypothetical protein